MHVARIAGPLYTLGGLTGNVCGLVDFGALRFEFFWGLGVLWPHVGKTSRCRLRRVLDQYFNVCLGISGREMELTRTYCFEFDQMLRADSKCVLLSTFCFYFRVAGFTYWSLHPVVDKNE